MMDQFVQERWRELQQMQRDDERAREDDADLKAQTAYLRIKLADSFLRNGKVARAIAEYKRAIKLDKKNGAFYTRLADAYVVAEEIPQAMGYYQQAIDLAPELAEPHSSLGDLYLRYAMFPQALAQYREAVRLESDRAYYHYQLGDTMEKMGLLREAEQELLDATLLAPKVAFYQFRVATLLQVHGHPHEAYHHLAVACRLAPYDDYYLVRLACLGVSITRLSDAITLLQRAVVLRPQNVAYQQLLANVYLLASKPDLHEQLTRRVGRLNGYDEEFVSRRMAEWHAGPAAVSLN